MLLKIRKLVKKIELSPAGKVGYFTAKDLILEFAKEWKGKAVKLERRKTREKRQQTDSRHRALGRAP
jgi:hypothetical protein